jgi:two-component system response regulator
MKILIAEDDADDRVLASIAFQEINSHIDIGFVKDGQELIDNLQLEVKSNNRLPDLVLLDLNMPRKDGRIALQEIKSNPKLRNLDVIIFSTSAAEEDKRLTLKLGAKSYIVKPSDYQKLMDIFKEISEELMINS